MKKIKQYISRENSVIDNNENLEHLYTFKNFPVFFGCVNTSFIEDLYADMVWKIDPLTGIIQLSKLIPLEILYMEQHVDATGSTWKKYNQDFANYVLASSKGNILEIGGGSGKIAKLILKKRNSVKFYAIEPNPLFEEQENLKIIKSFFNKGLKEKINSKMTTVIFSQVLEHAYNPEEFLFEINEFLEEGGKLVFAYPNLEHWFSEKYTNAINFEHTMLLTDYFLDYLLSKTGFEILDKTKYNNHSHFYTVVKTKTISFISIENQYNHYKKMFNDFIDYHIKMVNDLNNKIHSKGEIFLFGAHIFSQFLIQFGLDQNKIEFILDNSPLKQDKRLYGTELKVKSPSCLRNCESPTVILKAGIYNEEIKKDILENINPYVKFI